MTTTGATAAIGRHTGTFPAEPAQVRRARVALAGWLGDCPLACDAILIGSELAANSVVHSDSRDGGTFNLRAEVRSDCLLLEVEDAGGPWDARPHEDGRPHGLEVVAALAGPGNWGVAGDDRGRIAWARLER